MKKDEKPPLISWYETHGRHDLPWRKSSEAYGIYLSEIMLQQTQVKTVLARFYFPFLEKFPTLACVAKASEAEILKSWEGLGYYSRARNLYKSAQITQGILPKSAKELLKLPGIGLTTANAIACFAFGEKVPILDGNVKRILYRFYAQKIANEKLLWSYAHKLFASNASYAYEHNQALMDIGASLCTRTLPKCTLCPLNNACQGKNTPQEYPTKKPKKAKEQRKRTIIIYRHLNTFALFQNHDNLLKGLWGFKQVKTLEEPFVQFLGEIRHEYSHISLQADVYLCEGAKERFTEWFSEEQIKQLALSLVDYKAFSLLNSLK